MRLPDGSVMQSGLGQNPNNYGQERIYAPVVGVVLRLYFSDDPQNTSAAPMADQRGSQIQADVLVVDSGNDNTWLVPNVVILPEGPSGADDFCEAMPRACSQMIDGSQFRPDMCLDITKLDGDWCVVSFIAGSFARPIMVKWWPHPSNRTDPATLGFPVYTPSTGAVPSRVLNQGRRYFRRYAGLKQTITSQGSLFVDTNESNATLVGQSSGAKRQQSDDGGDIQVDVKPTRQAQINFNAPVALPTLQPSLPQPNPPTAAQTRKTDRTTVTLDKDTINLLAGKIVEILTSDDFIDLHAKTKVRMRGDDGNNSVILGDTDPASCDHVIKGETFRTLFNAFLDIFINHTHGTAVGPTSQPTNAAAVVKMDDTQLSLPVMVKK